MSERGNGGPRPPDLDVSPDLLRLAHRGLVRVLVAEGLRDDHLPPGKTLDDLARAILRARLFEGGGE